MKLRVGRPSKHFRIVVGLILVLALAIPVSAGARGSQGASKRGNYRGQCRQLTKQIDHFEGTILPLAIARGNRSWERATNAQVARLWHRRANLCPAYGSERTFILLARDQIRKFNKMVDLATRATVSFFTGGLTGGLGP